MIRKILIAVFVAAWAVCMISWVPLAFIEGEALHQPEKPTALYSRPMSIKGVRRYVTPGQARWDGLAHTGFTSGWLVALLAGGAALKSSKPRKFSGDS